MYYCTDLLSVRSFKFSMIYCMIAITMSYIYLFRLLFYAMHIQRSSDIYKASLDGSGHSKISAAQLVEQITLFTFNDNTMICWADDGEYRQTLISANPAKWRHCFE